MIENISEKGLVGDRVGGENTERQRAVASLFLHTFCMTINLTMQKRGEWEGRVANY